MGPLVCHDIGYDIGIRYNVGRKDGIRAGTPHRCPAAQRGDRRPHVRNRDRGPPAHPRPPLHTHDFDAVFYIREGELIFQVEDTLRPKGAGELSFAPRNVPHTLANHSDAPASYLLVCTPAGFERHWARLAAEAAGTEPPEWALKPIPEITVVGPPIAPQA